MTMLRQFTRRKLQLDLLRAPPRRHAAHVSKGYIGNGVLGIIREDYNVWERRSPLSPTHVLELISKHKCAVIVQPCMRRIYSDSEYAAVGATISNDLSSACLVLGIKAIRQENIQPLQSYMFFSHVIKAQPKSMPLLDTIINNKARLFDYECITKEGRDDLPRLVAFGKYAGMAGMIDGLQGIGVRLLAEGVSSPFLNVPYSFMHSSLQEARVSLSRVRDSIRGLGLQRPLIFAFTGNGNVSKGIREIFEQLPHHYVTIDDLPTLNKDIIDGKRSKHLLYAINVDVKDMVRLKDDSSGSFDKAHYYANPSLYEGCFHEKVLPYINVLVNGMYWDQKFPRLVTKQQIRHLRKGLGNYNFKVCLDITCDVGGSIEFLTKSTTINNPFFAYIPEGDESLDSVGPDSILMLGVDILPTELPKDSSDHFGTALMPFLPPLLASTGSQSPGEDDLPPEIKRSCITSHGKMLPKWNYIQRLRQTTEQIAATSAASTDLAANVTSINASAVAGSSIEMRGHLFDTGLINRVLDYLERENADNGIHFKITNTVVRPNTTSGAVPTVLLLQITQNEGDLKTIDRVINQIREIVKYVPLAECTLTQLLPSSTNMRKLRRVLLFGSGRVAKPVIKLFKSYDDVHVIVATDSEIQANELIDEMNSGSLARDNYDDLSSASFQSDSRASFVKYTFPEDNESLLSKLVSACDVIISLLPASMHVPVAKEAIKHKKHLVTASYVSKEMRALHDEAKAAGVALINEVGLDPGIDHLLIMQSIDDIKSRGGMIDEVVSLCGGLPDPVAADNPLLYKVKPVSWLDLDSLSKTSLALSNINHTDYKKISWSPRGALVATTNSARYLRNGEEINVPGEMLLRSAMPSERFPTLNLEVIPNRDSLAYRDLYGIPHVKSICRGTLRYVGWANVFDSFKALGLLATCHTSFANWRGLMEDLAKAVVKKHGEKKTNVIYESNISNSYVGLIEHALQLSEVTDVTAAMRALEWLGLTDDNIASNMLLSAENQTPIDSLCSLLENKLSYGASEKDMVAMFHSITGSFPNGVKEVHESRLLTFGEPNGISAMSSTVGYTTAIAAELLLNGIIKDTGCIIPTHKSLYVPMLERLKLFNITWTESVKVVQPKRQKSKV